MGSRGKPTNAKNAYNFFTSIMHEEFKSLFPGKTVNFIDFQKKCAGKWKSLTPEDKLPFEKMASLDKLRFQEGYKYRIGKRLEFLLAILFNGSVFIQQQHQQQQQH